jgi:hypothetical protein
MCHTLLQYYIHCSHIATHFYPCIITSHIRPPTGVDLYLKTYIHPNYTPPTTAAAHDNFLSSQWRDHSVPLSIAHSYHRLCPGCLEEQTVKDEEREERDRRARGVELWREYAQDNPNIHVGDIDSGDEDENEEEGGVDVDASQDGTGVDIAARRIAAPNGVDMSSIPEPFRETVYAQRRSAAIATALALGMQLSPAEPVEWWEQRIQDYVNARPWAASAASARVAAEIGRRNAVVAPMSRVTQARSRPPVTIRSGTAQGSMVDRSDPRALLEGQTQLQPQYRANGHNVRRAEEAARPPMSGVDEARRRQMFDAAIAEERRRIENIQASRTQPMLSEETMQRRLQPIRDLYDAPPLLATIPSVSGGYDRVSAADRLRAQAREIQGELDEMGRQDARAGRRRRRRGAAGAGELAADEALHVLASVERGMDRDEEAMTVDDEEHEESSIEEAFLQELARVHETTAAPLTAETTVPVQDRRSQSPSPEEEGPRLPRRVPEDFDIDNPYRLPKEPICAEHPKYDDRHLHLPSHAKGEHGKVSPYVATQYHKGLGPRIYNNSTETLARHTAEILVSYQACNHVEAVFVEQLKLHKDQSITAGCGCDAFDLRLLAPRRAYSRQKCLRCRTKGQEGIGRLSGEYVWLRRHVRKVRNRRELALWPFGAKSNDGVLDYR